MEEITAVSAQLPPRTPGTFWKLFRTCFGISACTFGGGLVVISMLQKKFVEELRWIDQDEVMDMCAIAQSCPGVMAVNTSIILGYRVGGVLGGLMTVLGTVLPPMVILSLVSLCYTQFRDNSIISLLLKGMQAGVAAVMIHMTITMSWNVIKEKDSLGIGMLLVSAVAVTWFSVDIITVILCCGVIGGLRMFWMSRKTQKGE